MNKSIQTYIEKCLPHFDETSQSKMMKAIRKAEKTVTKHQNENADSEGRHTFREFIPAAFLNEKDFEFEYEKKLEGKTPDWLDSKKKVLLEVFTFERGGTSSFTKRIRSTTKEKCEKYKDIILTKNLVGVIAIYLDFLTGIDLEDCTDEKESIKEIFEENECLSAILFFTEKMGFEYNYLSYYRNIEASEKLNFGTESIVL